MALSVKEETLQEALQHTGCRRLPPVLRENEVWIKAIALVRKITAVENYVLVENNGYNRPRITKDFGPCAYITGIKDIYPYELLDSKRTPTLRTDNETYKFLRAYGYDAKHLTALFNPADKTPEQIAADRETIKGYVTNVSIRLAKQNMVEDEKANELLRIKKKSDEKRKAAKTARNNKGA